LGNRKENDMRKIIKRLAAAVMAAAVVTAPALGAEGQPDPWAYGAIADSYAMGLMDDNYANYLHAPITGEQLEAMTDIVADKLALLGLPEADVAWEGLVLDGTRGGVVNALYQEAARYQIDGIGLGPEGFLTQIGVLHGDGAGNRLDRTCTYQEAMVMADRLILALYDANDAGSKGLLWKAVNGDNTLYLLGTIHLDRSNAYPLHKSVRSALLSADTVAFELDFNDAEGQAEFAAMQLYSDGTTLAEHISAELYSRVSAALTGLGMQEGEFALYKPWALANSFTVLSLMDETSSANAMAIDLYCNSLASWADIPVAGVETYTLQGNIFDTLDPAYLEAYLEGALSLYEAAQAGAEPDQETAAAVQQNEEVMAAMFEAWKARDPEGFDKAYEITSVQSSFDRCVSLLKRGGVMIQVGMPPAGKMFDLDINKIIYRECDIRGVRHHTMFDMQRAVRIIDSGVLNDQLKKLVSAVYPLEELMPAAKKMASIIAGNAPIAVRNCKKAINDGLQVGIDEALVIEEKLFGDCFETEDQKYGMAFFLDRNKDKVKEPFQNK